MAPAMPFAVAQLPDLLHGKELAALAQLAGSGMQAAPNAVLCWWRVVVVVVAALKVSSMVGLGWLARWLVGSC